MGVILEIDTEDSADFGHEGRGAGGFVIAVVVVAEIDFVDFAGVASTWDFEVAGERKHSDIAGVLTQANHHNRIGELGAVVGAVIGIAGHVVTTGAES